MSSPKAATAKRSRPAPAVAVTSKPPHGAHEPGVSDDAVRIAGEVEKALLTGRADVLTVPALQALMAACCKAYTARTEAGEDLLALKSQTTVSPTEVMTTASGLLRAANLAVFELGMWQSWTGR